MAKFAKRRTKNITAVAPRGPSVFRVSNFSKRFTGIVIIPVVKDLNQGSIFLIMVSPEIHAWQLKYFP